MVSARIQEDRRVIVTTLKIGAVYSPVVDSARKMGRNAAAVVSDAMSNGTRSSRAESTAASAAGLPSDICTIVDSTMTMALSTSIPRAIIRDARETWSRPIPKIDMTRSAITMAIGIRLATTRPVRRPRKSSITTATTPTACNRLPTKSLTFFSTSRGWKATTSNSMPIG